MDTDEGGWIRSRTGILLYLISSVLISVLWTPPSQVVNQTPLLPWVRCTVSAAAFAAFPAHSFIGAEVDFADLFAHRVAHLRDAVADDGGALEFERLSGGVHFDFQLGDVFLGDVLSLVG